MAQTLEDLGHLLREERELRELSIEQVAEGLKISTRILYALESGDSDSLPHIVYVRGFVSAYAKYLGLDLQDVLANPVLYEREVPEQTPAKPVKSTKPAVAQRPWKAFRIHYSLVIALCICILGGYTMWYYRDVDIYSLLQPESLNIAEPAPVIPPAQNSVVQNDNSSENEIVERKMVEKVQQPVKITQTVAEKAASLPKQKQEDTARPTSSQAVIQMPEPVEETVGPRKVVITVLNAGNIEANADETGVRRFSVKAGEVFALTFDYTLKLDINDAGGVRVHYNGKEMSPGRTGEAKTLLFPPEV